MDEIFGLAKLAEPTNVYDH